MEKQLLIFLAFSLTFLSSESFRIGNYFKDSHVSSDPDLYLTTPKIIRRHGYPAETHIIQTEDGYLLEYHRIPHGKNKRAATRPYPVLLHHGLLCSSIDWVINGPDKGLGYKLADEGYDVWLANARGNTYSRSHISLTPTDEKFWDFTFHEVGIYDVPAAVDYILNTTNAQKLIYIGHSLGTTTFFAFSTGRPEYRNKILTQISVAPVASIFHTTSIFRLLVPIAKEIRSMTEWYNRGAFLEHDALTSAIYKYICDADVFNTNICEQLIIFNLFGKDKEQFNITLIPLIISSMPAGTSGKNMIHCSQLISSGKFQYYDYGIVENIKRYKSAKPPQYNISSISIPMRFYYAKNDILADPTDVELLYQNISKPMGLNLINNDKWNHVDYLWAIDVNKYFNDELIEFVNNITNKSGFISETIQKALFERRKHSVPQNVPFNETDFKKRVAQMPELFNFSKAVDQVPNMIHNNLENNVNIFAQEIDKKMKTVNDSIRKTARSINDGIQKTSDEVQRAIQMGVSKTEEGMNSVKEINRRMKEMIDQLARTLEH